MRMHMLTEKALKPLSGGHPFLSVRTDVGAWCAMWIYNVQCWPVQVCAEADQLATGEDFGFDMFRNTLNNISAEQYNMHDK